jgi:plasmid stabilization system protein ParE
LSTISISDSPLTLASRYWDLSEDLGPDVRCFSFRKNYVVIYRPLDDGIDVLRVFHTSRDYARLFREGRR